MILLPINTRGTSQQKAKWENTPDLLFSCQNHDEEPMSQEMNYDVVIVGAGPAGLGAAIRLKQLDPTIKVCILEKGADVGSHILSGAVIEPRALQELFPDWEKRAASLITPVIEDQFLLLTSSSAFRLPTPPQMRNKGNFVTSLGALC